MSTELEPSAATSLDDTWGFFLETQDEASRQQLIERYLPRVRRCVRNVHRFVKHLWYIDLDDLESEGYTALVYAIDNYNPFTTNARSTESFIDHLVYRAINRYVATERESHGRIDADAGLQECIDERQWEESSIRHVLEGLPERQRMVLTLRFVDKLTFTEIAARLDIGVGTVFRALGVGMKTLREQHAGGFHNGKG